MTADRRTLSWFDIVRLGAVQMAIGSIVVLMTSTLNRLMVVELALPAVLPGALVALHYGIQISRPSWGFLSDASGKRSFWIVAGMAILAAGGLTAAAGVWLIGQSFWPGLLLSILAYSLIGLGVGASGTSLLALLAATTAPNRRAAAATITWLMMIFGIAATAGTVGAFLDPYTPAKLLRIVALVAAGAITLTGLAIWGIERRVHAEQPPEEAGFMEGLREVWAEPEARNFTLWVFLSMNAYFMQELILEPYAGLVFGFAPGESTQLSGFQNMGVLLGMITVGVACTGLRIWTLRHWVVLGCLGSAAMLGVIAGLGSVGPGAPLVPAVVGMGYFNGMFAVAAIGSMMMLAGHGRGRREGTRMGLWGAAQAIAAGFGGLLGAAAVDAMRAAMATDAPAFAIVFTAEAVLYLASAALAARLIHQPAALSHAAAVPGE